MLPLSRSAARVVTLILVVLALVVALSPLQASPVQAQGETAVADATLRVIHAWQLSALGAAAVTSGAGEYLQAATEDARARATRWVSSGIG